MNAFAFVIALGNPFDGISLTGPFWSHNEALNYADSEFMGYDWTILSLDPPEERRA